MEREKRKGARGMRIIKVALREDESAVVTPATVYMGEHRAVRLEITLPERLKTGFDFYTIAFDVMNAGKRIPLGNIYRKEEGSEATAWMENGVIFCDLPNQLTHSTFTRAQVEGHREENGACVLLEKSVPFVLRFEDSITGEGEALSAFALGHMNELMAQINSMRETLRIKVEGVEDFVQGGLAEAQDAIRLMVVEAEDVVTEAASEAKTEISQTAQLAKIDVNQTAAQAKVDMNQAAAQALNDIGQAASLAASGLNDGVTQANQAASQAADSATQAGLSATAAQNAASQVEVAVTDISTRLVAEFTEDAEDALEQITEQAQSDMTAAVTQINQAASQAESNIAQAVTNAKENLDGKIVLAASHATAAQTYAGEAQGAKTQATASASEAQAYASQAEQAVTNASALLVDEFTQGVEDRLEAMAAEAQDGMTAAVTQVNQAASQAQSSIAQAVTDAQEDLDEQVVLAASHATAAQGATAQAAAAAGEAQTYAAQANQSAINAAASATQAQTTVDNAVQTLTAQVETALQGVDVQQAALTEQNNTITLQPGVRYQISIAAGLTYAEIILDDSAAAAGRAQEFSAVIDAPDGYPMVNVVYLSGADIYFPDGLAINDGNIYEINVLDSMLLIAGWGAGV